MDFPDDRRFAVVLQVHPELSVRTVVQHLEVLDEVIVAKQPRDFSLELRDRNVDAPMSCTARIPNPRQHICYRISHVRYQLALRTPGISPRSADVLKQIRHKPNFRRKPRDRPHRLQRLYPLTPNFGFLPAFTTKHFLAMCLSVR